MERHELWNISFLNQQTMQRLPFKHYHFNWSHHCIIHQDLEAAAPWNTQTQSSSV